MECPASLYKEKTDYLHTKANQMIEAFDPANQLVKDEVLALPEEQSPQTRKIANAWEKNLSRLAISFLP